MASPTQQQTKHDVFLSFRGEDTRKTFISHLHNALTKAGIDAFIDNRIHGGEDISDTLLSKISGSQVCVVVFSQNYADSRWCLDELVKIVQCKKEMGHALLPVFLGVDPSDVRRQTGRFGDGFNGLVRNGQFKDRKEKWREALYESSNVSGWDSAHKSEGEIVEEIVKRIEKILDEMLFDYSDDGFVGISRVEKVESLLCIHLSGRRESVGIWGMGGIGKTTIASQVFKRVSNQFEGVCFLGNVRERSEREGLDCLRKDMILQLLGGETSSTSLNSSSPIIQKKLKRKKVIVFLDDVSSLRQLKTIVGDYRIYGLGSRFLVTSRDKQVLKNGCTKIYEVERLNDSEALQLFRLHAFKQNQLMINDAKYIELSEKATMFAQGLPLALEVLGCNLYDKGIKEWESELAKLREIPDMQVEDILRISYDGLDEMEKSIFLDIAVVFNGWLRDDVETILDSCGFYAARGISRLLDKALLVTSGKTILMHDLLQQMGRDITLQESIEEPSRRRWLWRSQDIYDVLTRGMGSEKVEVISLNLFDVPEMHLNPEAFLKMLKLRVLNFYGYGNHGNKIYLPKGLDFLSNELRYFRWDKFPSASLPQRFCPEYLIELDLRESHIKELWGGESNEPCLPNLKYMDLGFSKNLIRLPDFSRILNLEILDIYNCESLVEVPSSIQHLSKLEWLSLESNINLVSFPSCVQLTNLQDLNLKGCSKITEFPQIPQNIVSLEVSGTAIAHLPLSIGGLSRLESLSLDGCRQLEMLPDNVCELKALQSLNLNRCSKLACLPDNLGNCESLQTLKIDGSAIRSLPDSIGSLKHLEILTIRRCLNMNELPDNLGNINSLCQLYTANSAIKYLPSSVHHLMKLECLHCWGYRGSELPHLTLASLRTLNLRKSNLETLPDSIKELPNLAELLLRDCKNLKFVPELPSSLELLEAVNCTSLHSIHSLFREGDGEPGDEYFQSDFYNCVSLTANARTMITKQAWSRILCIKGSGFVMESDEDDKWTPEDERDVLKVIANLRILGGEVPGWFKYCYTGPTTYFEPSSGQRLLNVHQLAFSAVVSVPHHYGPNDFTVACLGFLVDKNGKNFHKKWFHNRPQYLEVRDNDAFNQREVQNKEDGSDDGSALQTEHVFLWYAVRGFHKSPWYLMKGQFDFYVVDGNSAIIHDAVIKECGVTPLVD